MRRPTLGTLFSGIGAIDLEEFILRRIDVNGHPFEAWEADPAIIRATP